MATSKAYCLLKSQHSTAEICSALDVKKSSVFAWSGGRPGREMREKIEATFGVKQTDWNVAASPAELRSKPQKGRYGRSKRSSDSSAARLLRQQIKPTNSATGQAAFLVIVELASEHGPSIKEWVVPGSKAMAKRSADRFVEATCGQ